MGESDGSWSTNLRTNLEVQIPGPLCNCGRSTVLVKSWSDANPGRNFFRCTVHGFFNWSDAEPSHGWQKRSLLEARDDIRRQKEEIKILKESLRATSREVRSTSVKTELVKKHEDEKERLEYDVMASNEREKMLRQFIVLSWIGFIIVIAMILGICMK